MKRRNQSSEMWFYWVKRIARDRKYEQKHVRRKIGPTKPILHKMRSENSRSHNEKKSKNNLTWTRHTECMSRIYDLQKTLIKILGTRKKPDKMWHKEYQKQYMNENCGEFPVSKTIKAHSK